MFVFYLLLIILAVCTPISTVNATEVNTDTQEVTEGNDGGGLRLEIGNGEEGSTVTTSIQMVILFTLISLAPSILIMMTSFTRILIVLHFLRSALGTQQTPPNQILIGISLFLTFFIMAPVFSDINTNAVKPLTAGEISQEEAIDSAELPIREFMLNQGNDKDLNLFMEISGQVAVETYDDIPMTTIIPAFIISELRAAFIIGFVIYIPFIIIDMVVASVLMAMGMMMLPPAMISMPFKILLFVMVDGWGLLLGSLVKTFY